VQLSIVENIIDSEGVFSYKTNMVSKESIYTDTVNSLGIVIEKFHWLISYERYVNLSTNEKNTNKIWTSGLANVACLP